MPHAKTATHTSDAGEGLGRPTIFEVLDLDPESSLDELAEGLRDLALSADPRDRERARRAFERLTEHPEKHFQELVATVPREPREPRVPVPIVRPVERPLSLRDLVPSVRLSERLGPPTDAERSLVAPSIALLEETE